MKNIKVWPHLTIVAIVAALLAGLGVGLYMKHEQIASAAALPDAARIQRVDGDVALNNSLAAGDNGQSDQWYAASANQPFSVGDRIYTRENSRASLAFTGRNFARLNPNTSLDVLSLDERRTQLALRDGSAMFDVGYLQPDDLFEVATPYGAVDFQQPGLYNVGIDNGQVLVSALSGVAQVVGLGGNGQISKGEMLTLLGQTAADVVLSQLDGRNAGYLVDDYYSYQYPRYYDGRYRDYNAYLNDPYYFDPYRRDVSYQYVNSYIPGLSDLDYYGDWQNVSGYGNCWSPRVDASWSPYESGYWINDYPYGPTWVSNEPWGYAPYHYGRWANVSNRWYWVPDSTSVTPVYSPALVAFVPFGQNDIGWVPLGPGDAYVPHYYTTNWQPQYLSRDNLYPRVANLNVPNAVTVVSADDFWREDDFRRARRADRNSLAQAKPVLDPLLVTPLRNAVVHSAWGRGKKDIPPGIAKKLQDTTVITSTAPVAPPFRRDLARTMHVEEASDRAKGQKFKVRDERQGRGAPQAANAPAVVNGQPEPGRPADNGRAAQGGQPAERGRPDNGRPVTSGPPAQPAPVERAERGRGRQQQPSPQGERVAQPAQQQPQAERNARPVQRPQGERVARPEQQRPQAERGRGRPVQQPQAQPAARPVPRVERAPKPAKPERPVQQQQQQQRAQQQQQQRAQQQQQQRAQQQQQRAAQRPQAERPAAQPKQERPQGERVSRPAERPHPQPQAQQKQGPPQKQSAPKGQPGGGKGKPAKPGKPDKP